MVPASGDSCQRWHPAHTKLPSRDTFPVPAMCSTAFTSPAGSPKASPWCEESSSAATPTGGHQHTNLTCSETCFTLLRRADHLTDAHQSHLDRIFDAHPRPANRVGRAPRAIPALRSRRPRRGQPGARTVRRSLRHRPDTRIPPSRGHHHRMGRTDLGLPHHPTTGIQRTHRRDQQPPTSPTTRRPRVHQLRQLRSPGNPCNMSPTPSASTAKTHDFAQPPLVWSWGTRYRPSDRTRGDRRQLQATGQQDAHRAVSQAVR